MITLYGFSNVNERVVGLTRDLRVLWALEETGLEYRVHGLDHPAKDLESEAFRRISPFGQIPAIDDDGFVLTESGAIVLYIAEKAGKLVPTDPQGRARVMRWCFAALTTLEPTMVQILNVDMMGDRDPTGAQRRPALVELAHHYFRSLEQWLALHAYTNGDEFTVADILMTGVLREVDDSHLLGEHPRIAAYQRRCESRPAWQRTLDEYEKRLGAPIGSAR